jgi:hypothetical protein
MYFTNEKEWTIYHPPKSVSFGHQSRVRDRRRAWAMTYSPFLAAPRNSKTFFHASTSSVPSASATPISNQTPPDHNSTYNADPFVVFVIFAPFATLR